MNIPEHWFEEDEAGSQNHACVCSECTDICGPGIHFGYRCRDCSKERDEEEPCHPE